MEYIVYETTNLVNNKFYIGVHKTEDSNVFDGYIGCGVYMQHPSSYMNPKTPFQFAVKKCGIKNFKRKILKVFDNVDDALKLEAELVAINFIKRTDTYNIALGGTESEIDITQFSYHHGTPTYKYSASGKLVDSYESVTEAAKDAGCKEKVIYRAIKSGMKRGDYYYSYTLTDNFIPNKLPSLKGKTIYVYDLEGNYVTSLLSGEELKTFFNTTHYGNIRQALLNDRPYKGYQLSLEKKDKLHKANAPQNISKRIGCYDLNGNLVEEFSSIKQTTKKYGSGVFRVLNNRQKQTKGFIFKYL